MALFLFTRAILNDEPIQVFNYGKMQRDFTYIDDIVEGVYRVMQKAPQPDPHWSGDAPDPGTSYAPYRVYNIGNNQPVELMEFIRTLEECLGKEAKKELLPIQPGDVPATYADVDDLTRDFGFKPVTSIRDASATSSPGTATISGHKKPPIAAEGFAAGGGDADHVFQPHAPEAREIDAGLHGEHHVLLQDDGVFLSVAGFFVDGQAHPVAPARGRRRPRSRPAR